MYECRQTILTWAQKQFIRFSVSGEEPDVQCLSVPQEIGNVLLPC